MLLTVVAGGDSPRRNGLFYSWVSGFKSGKRRLSEVYEVFIKVSLITKSTFIQPVRNERLFFFSDYHMA
jgi:hypothetical protein